MSNTHKLVYAIIQFLKSQLEDNKLSEECAEGVEVGIQCLEAAYNVNSSQITLKLPCSLEEIFDAYLTEYEAQATPEDKALAETLKNEGNAHMSAENFAEAIACYSKAIRLDPKNAVYYCNRAAATNKMGKFESAIEDCKTALKIDPTYCKAYGRLGLAYSSLSRYQDAIDNYKKALEIEPDNESHRANMKLAEEALAAGFNPLTQSQQNADLSIIFANPSLISMASQMLANPSMQYIMNNILTGNVSQGETGGIDTLIQASQQLAQQMETENPALVEQLRRQMSRASGSSGGSSSGAEPKAPQPQDQ